MRAFRPLRTGGTLSRGGVKLYGFADVRGLFGSEWGEGPPAVRLVLALSAEV